MENDQVEPGAAPEDESLADQSEDATQDGAEHTEEETSEEDIITELQEQIETLQAQADEYLDKYRRSAAEFTNYRKRQQRDREQQTQRVWMEALRRFLPIVDDFALAVKALPENLAEVEWATGVTLISRKIDGFFDGCSVKPIEALGEPFDPNYHSAMLHEPSSEHPSGIVTEEIQKGYLLGDEVLRPSMVKVSSGPANPGNNQEE